MKTQHPRRPAARPGLALAARLVLDVDANARDAHDALVYRHPVLVVVGSAIGLTAWRRCGAPWPQSDTGQTWLLIAVVGLVMGLFSAAMGRERFTERIERLKTMDVGVISVPIVIGGIALVALWGPR